MATIGCVIKSPVAHILRSGWKKKRIAKEKPIFLLKFSWCSNTLVVLNNSWYIKEYLPHSGSEYAKVLNISNV